MSSTFVPKQSSSPSSSMEEGEVVFIAMGNSGTTTTTTTDDDDNKSHFTFLNDDIPPGWGGTAPPAQSPVENFGVGCNLGSDDHGGGGGGGNGGGGGVLLPPQLYNNNNNNNNNPYHPNNNNNIHGGNNGNNDNDDHSLSQYCPEDVASDFFDETEKLPPQHVRPNNNNSIAPFSSSHHNDHDNNNNNNNNIVDIEVTTSSSGGGGTNNNNVVTPTVMGSPLLGPSSSLLNSSSFIKRHRRPIQCIIIVITLIIIILIVFVANPGGIGNSLGGEELGLTTATTSTVNNNNNNPTPSPTKTDDDVPTRSPMITIIQDPTTATNQTTLGQQEEQEPTITPTVGPSSTEPTTTTTTSGDILDEFTLSPISPRTSSPTTAVPTTVVPTLSPSIRPTETCTAAQKHQQQHCATDCVEQNNDNLSGIPITNYCPNNSFLCTQDTQRGFFARQQSVTLGQPGVLFHDILSCTVMDDDDNTNTNDDEIYISVQEITRRKEYQFQVMNGIETTSSSSSSSSYAIKAVHLRSLNYTNFCIWSPLEDCAVLSTDTLSVSTMGDNINLRTIYLCVTPCDDDDDNDNNNDIIERSPAPTEPTTIPPSSQPVSQPLTTTISPTNDCPIVPANNQDCPAACSQELDQTNTNPATICPTNTVLCTGLTQTNWVFARAIDLTVGNNAEETLFVDYVTCTIDGTTDTIDILVEEIIKRKAYQFRVMNGPYAVGAVYLRANEGATFCDWTSSSNNNNNCAVRSTDTLYAPFVDNALVTLRQIAMCVTPCDGGTGGNDDNNDRSTVIPTTSPITFTPTTTIPTTTVPTTMTPTAFISDDDDDDDTGATWEATDDDVGILSGDGPNEQFGKSIAMNANGNIIAVVSSDSNNMNDLNPSSIVRVFMNVNGTWSLHGNEIIGTGKSNVALSGNGLFLVVGDPDAESQKGTITTYRFNQNSQRWQRRYKILMGDEAASGNGGGGGDDLVNGGFLSLSRDGDGDSVISTSGGTRLGSVMALSHNGRVLVTGEPSYDQEAGRVRMYLVDRDIENDWILTSFAPPVLNFAGDRLGASVALSPDGSRVVVGSPGVDLVNNLGTVVVDAGRVTVYDYSFEQGTTTSTTTTGVDGIEFQEGMGHQVQLFDDGITIATLSESGRTTVHRLNADDDAVAVVPSWSTSFDDSSLVGTRDTVASQIAVGMNVRGIMRLAIAYTTTVPCDVPECASLDLFQGWVRILRSTNETNSEWRPISWDLSLGAFLLSTNNNNNDSRELALRMSRRGHRVAVGVSVGSNLIGDAMSGVVRVFDRRGNTDNVG